LVTPIEAYFAYYQDASIPWYERGLAGALLPVALPVLGIVSLSGCAPETYSCMGRGSTACDGLAAQETYVTFKEGYLTPEEQEGITQFIENFEQPLRRMSPSLFCAFNGWEVTDDIEHEGASAVYLNCEKKIQLPASLSAYAHEFGHYIDDWHGINHGGELASDTIAWSAISCFEQNHDPEYCIDAPSNTKRGGMEEFANICASSIAVSPAGNIVRASSNTNTLNQASFMAGVLGLDEDIVDAVKSGISSEGYVSVNYSQYEGNFNIYEGERDLWIHERNVPIQTVALSNGGYAYYNSQRIIFHQLMRNSWTSVSPAVPAGIDIQEPFSIDSMTTNGRQALIKQGSAVWEASERSATVGFEFKLVVEDESLSNFGEAKYLGGEIIVYGAEGYAILDEDRAYKSFDLPPNITEDIRKAWSARLIGASEGPEIAPKHFLWVNAIDDKRYGKVSRLFAVERDEEGLSFEKVFELPTTSGLALPFFYKQDWYILETVTNDYLSPSMTETDMYLGNAIPPIFLRVRDGGRSIKPFLPAYPSDDQFAPVRQSIVRRNPYFLQVVGDNFFMNCREGAMSMFELDVPRGEAEL
jgi:hypothetical protein